MLMSSSDTSSSETSNCQPASDQGLRGNVLPNERGTKSPSWGAWVVIAALVTLAAIFALAQYRYHKAGDVTAVMASVGGIIAAIVGAYFGIRGAILGQGGGNESGSTSGRRGI